MDFQKVKFYISPYFVIKSPLLRDIKKANYKFSFNGNILDIGCGEKPYKKLFNFTSYLGIDFKSFSKNNDYKGEKPDNYFSDDYLENLILPFNDSEFDNVLAFQVLEHHKNPEIFFKEINRVLKKNGLLMLSFPFIEGIHEEPNDFQRFSKYGIERILKDNNFELLEIYSQGKFFSVIFFLFSEYLNILASKNKFYYYFISILYLSIFLPLQYFSMFLDLFIKTDAFVINYLVVARNKK
jgi:SAM-dependent methyltransferase